MVVLPLNSLGDEMANVANLGLTNRFGGGMMQQFLPHQPNVPVPGGIVPEVEEEEDLKTRVMSRLGQGFKNPAMGDAMTAYGLQMMGPQFAQQNRGLLSSFGG